MNNYSYFHEYSAILFINKPKIKNSAGKRAVFVLNIKAYLAGKLSPFFKLKAKGIFSVAVT